MPAGPNSFDLMPLLAQADAPMQPMVLVSLCAVAGIGTVLLLPSKREASIRKIGGVVLVVAAVIFSALLTRWTAGNSADKPGVYFWIFSAIALLGAVRVVTHSKPVYSALYFVLTVFASAGLFLLMHAEFMAVALVLIYAGAILVTYVFVIMLAAEAVTPANRASALGGMTHHDARAREPVAACAVGFGMMALLLFVIFDRSGTIELSSPAAKSIVTGSTQKLGEFLFTNHIVNLELAGLILTIAMVGAIVIARKQVIGAESVGPTEVVTGPATPVDDDPHSIPVVGTTNPRQKEYPET